jgi:hypothetical protein
LNSFNPGPKVLHKKKAHLKQLKKPTSKSVFSSDNSPPTNLPNFSNNASFPAINQPPNQTPPKPNKPLLFDHESPPSPLSPQKYTKEGKETAKLALINHSIKVLVGENKGLDHDPSSHLCDQLFSLLWFSSTNEPLLV